MQKGVFKGRIPASAMNVTILGYTFSEPVLAHLHRAQRLGMNLIGSPKATSILAKQGIKKMEGFLEKDGFAGILKYPQAGLPVSLINGISLIEPTDVDKFTATGGKMIHLVFSEIDETNGVNADGTSEEVAQMVHYNVTNALERAVAAGRITSTNAKSLGQFLDMIEAAGAEGITAEVYEALAIVNAPMTMTAVSGWNANLAGSMEPFTEGANAVLEGAGVLQEAQG